MATLFRRARLSGTNHISFSFSRFDRGMMLASVRIPHCCSRLGPPSHRSLSHLSATRVTSASMSPLLTRGSVSQLFRSRNLNKKYLLCSSFAGVRWNSSESTASSLLDTASSSSSSLLPGYIPEPPPIPVPATPDPVTEVTLNALGEPTLSCLGLANYTPAGAVQTMLEYVHCLDIPWWTTIVIGTICLRCVVFPLVILGQRNAANMNNHMPTIQRLQEKFSEARMSGNPLEAARAGSEIADYMKRNDVRPFRSMLVPMAQVPIFVSVFVGMRQMANLPVESMKTGGMLWFTDLTVPDPLFLMPVMTMATFLLTVELGVDGVRAATMSHTMRWAMRIMPFVILPFIINFPSALLCYWFTSNVFSLIQVMFLKIPRIREFFKIPKLVVHPDSMKPKKKKFVEGFKDTWSNSKMLAQVEDRQRADAVRFKEAGNGPIVKTYPYDPTKVRPGINAKSK